MGVVVAGFYAVFLPRMMATAPAGTAVVMAGIVAAIILTVLFIVIPGVMIFFYGGKSVKATCEARDPVARWTDACPLPVLAASLCLGVGALSMLLMPLGYKSVIPFFGTLLAGFPATLFFIVWAVGSGWLAWALYRLKPSAWWAVVVVFVMFSLSSAITFARIDIMEMYRQMGYSQQQVEQMQKFSFISGRNFSLWTVCCMAPWIGYLLWIKKYFRRSA